MNIVYAIAIVLGAYLLGAIPTGYWIVKATKGIDIRTVGSGSTGATNVLRAAGKGPALFVFFFDIFKGFILTFYAGTLDHTLWNTLPVYYPYVIPALAGVVAIVGHSKSIFLGFTGGKSAATTLGTLYGLNPLAATLTFVVWLLVVFLSRFVSLASILAAISCPIFMTLVGAPHVVIGFSLFACFYVIIRHKDNIKRLMAGTESKIGSKPKVAAAENKDAEQK